MLATDHVHDRKQTRVQSATGVPASVPRFARLGNMAAGSPRKFVVGGVDVETHVIDVRQMLHLTTTARSVDVIVPISGRVDVASAGASHKVEPGAALLLAQRAGADCTWSAGSVGLILRFPRLAAQARHFADSGQPRRIGAGVLRLSCGDPAEDFGAGLSALADAAPSLDAERGRAAGLVLVGALVDALAATPDRSPIFPLSASVQRALDQLALHPDRITQEELASAAGLTLARLRRNVRECTGLTLTRLLVNARLDWVHERLKSPTEARSIGQLANAIGHAVPAVFNRAYQRRFGETPTRTRARAFGRG